VHSRGVCCPGNEVLTFIHHVFAALDDFQTCWLIHQTEDREMIS
jgi:hypothetical protein